jgi:LysM repeat protein
MVRSKLKTLACIFLVLLALWGSPTSSTLAFTRVQRPAQQVAAYELIIAMNTLRVSFGLQALVEDPIINAVAQATAEIMAANQMSWHIGDVSGRLQAAGFGGGAKVWATENFAVGSNHSIDTIMQVWSDESHMFPAVNPAYCAVGAGTAKSSNGMTYYVLQAAYTTGKSCGEYKPSTVVTSQPGTPNPNPGISQIIVPVKVATPDADGKVFHEVAAGQSLWAIAVTYQITIDDIVTWNNISRDTKLQIGQKLFIPGKNTAGYATPTPVGMILASTPDADGRIIHVVQAYNTLITIAQAYQVDVPTILALNGIQEDWPLQIGQKLVIHGELVTPTPTPLPLTPLQKLTPGEDGKYYHMVESGETLSWIAELYEITVANLMAWNGLNNTSILYPEQKLLLQVTPPATVTATPAPPTLTPTPTIIPPSLTPSHTASVTASLTPTPQPDLPISSGRRTIGIVLLGASLVGLALVLILRTRARD